MWVRILRCRYCQREMEGDGSEHAENPFCVRCLDERMSSHPGARPVQWVESTDGYLVPIILESERDGEDGPGLP